MPAGSGELPSMPMSYPSSAPPSPPTRSAPQGMDPRPRLGFQAPPLFFAKIRHNQRWRGQSSRDPSLTLPSSPWRGDGDDDRRVLAFPFSRRRRRGAPSRRPCPARGGGGAYLAVGPALLEEDGADGLVGGGGQGRRVHRVQASVAKMRINAWPGGKMDKFLEKGGLLEVTSFHNDRSQHMLTSTWWVPNVVAAHEERSFWMYNLQEVIFAVASVAEVYKIELRPLRGGWNQSAR